MGKVKSDRETDNLLNGSIICVESNSGFLHVW
jgi:hypothetical protein